MSNNDEIRIPLRIDTSHIESDLRAVDPEIEKLERRFVQAFNTSDLVKSGFASRVQTAAQAQAALSAFPPADQARMGDAIVESRRSYEARATQLTQTAQNYRGFIPLTAEQQAKRDATERLQQTARQNQRPIDVLINDQSMRKFGEVFKASRLDYAALQAARGNVAGVGRNLLSGLGTLTEDSTFLMGGLGVLGAGIGLGIEGSSTVTAMNRQAALMSSALVGGPTTYLGQMGQQLSLQQQAMGYGFDADQMRRTSTALAQAGVPNRALAPAMGSTLLFAQAMGLSPDSVAPLTASLATTGGMTPRQIARTYQDLADAQRAAGVPAAQLVDTMKALAQTASGATRNVADLAAIQQSLGTSRGVTAGQVMAGTLSSTGWQAAQQSALLGYPSVTAFITDQQNHPARVYDRLSALMRRIDVGPMGTANAEQMLSDSFGYTAGSTQELRALHGMLSNAPGQTSGRALQIRARLRGAPPIHNDPTKARDFMGELGQNINMAWNWGWSPQSSPVTAGSALHQSLGDALGNAGRAAGGLGNWLGQELNVTVMVQDSYGKPLQATATVTPSRKPAGPPAPRKPSR